MTYASYISRVGALAVALGIGTGLAATPWVASAKPPNSDSSSTSSDSSSSSSSSSSSNSAPNSSSSPSASSPPAPSTPDAGTESGGETSASNTEPATPTGRGSDNSTAAAPDGDNTTTATDGRPVQGKGTGTININTATGALTGEESGVSSHLGKYNLRLQGTSTRSADGTVNSNGTVTIVAANGDQLTGTFTLTGREPSLTAVVTITGGTGRFANASGTLTVVCVISGASQQEPVLVIKHDCITEGAISY